MAKIYSVDFIDRKLLNVTDLSKESDETLAPNQATYDKQAYFSRLLARGKTTVTLDPSAPGVDLPEEFLGQAALSLTFSNAFNSNDLEIADGGVSQTLSFPNIKYKVFAPWNSIAAIQLTSANEGREWKVEGPFKMVPLDLKDEKDPEPPEKVV